MSHMSQMPHTLFDWHFIRYAANIGCDILWKVTYPCISAYSYFVIIRTTEVLYSYVVLDCNEQTILALTHLYCKSELLSVLLLFYNDMHIFTDWFHFSLRPTFMSHKLTWTYFSLSLVLNVWLKTFGVLVVCSIAEKRW